MCLQLRVGSSCTSRMSRNLRPSVWTLETSRSADRDKRWLSSITQASRISLVCKRISVSINTNSLAPLLEPHTNFLQSLVRLSQKINKYSGFNIVGEDGKEAFVASPVLKCVTCECYYRHEYNCALII